MACTSIKDRDVPLFGWKSTRDDDTSFEVIPVVGPGSMNRAEKLGSTGRAVLLVCFFRIFRVASEVAYWNCGWHNYHKSDPSIERN